MNPVLKFLEANHVIHYQNCAHLSRSDFFKCEWHDFIGGIHPFGYDGIWQGNLLQLGITIGGIIVIAAIVRSASYLFPWARFKLSRQRKELDHIESAMASDIPNYRAFKDAKDYYMLHSIINIAGWGIAIMIASFIFWLWKEGFQFLGAF